MRPGVHIVSTHNRCTDMVTKALLKPYMMYESCTSHRGISRLALLARGVDVREYINSIDPLFPFYILLQHSSQTGIHIIAAADPHS